ncbi:MAG: NAD+ synthase [Actinobacteria bacterium HGW-Actinobacteria-4]|nr:MAG: NAD+ synthase [Actinobacteria bacterium HGW-Actinobacteria-4]
MSNLRVALAQVNPCVGDIEGNAALVMDQARAAHAAGAQVVVFPEMVITGYPIEDLALRESFQRAAERAVDHVAVALSAEGLGGLTVVLGTLGVNAAGDALNEAVVIQRGEVSARYAKHHLPNYGVFDERRIFKPGTGKCVIELDGRRVGIVICEDIWQDGGPVATMAASDVQLLLVLNGSPFEEGKGHVRTDLAIKRAREVEAPLAYVNLWGGQDDLVFDGHSFIVGADGHMLASAPGFADALLLWDVPDDDDTPAATQVVEHMEQDAQVYWACVTGLRDYVHKNGFQKVVLGLSGGIDSALVAMIAADALGGPNVIGVSMPSKYSSDHSKSDAQVLAENLGVDYRVQSIEPMVAAFDAELGLEGIAAENIQARVRGMIIMGLSNSEGAFALATGNKSELATGYSTMYGDAVGAFAPIKDLDKTRVWDLSRWRNAYAVSRGESAPIPEASITKPPSAELRPGQLDQDSLPAYDLLDEVLDAYVEHAEGRAELLARGFDEAVVDKVLSLVDRAEWKRRQYPPGPKVTALAFGRDRRLPITSRWRERAE